MICVGIFCVATLAAAIDGDTFRVPDDPLTPPTRIHGIDTPERGEDGWEAARDALQALIDDGVMCRFDSWSFSRRVMQCFDARGRDVACELVRAGHARDVLRYSRGAYRECARDE